MAKLTPEQIQTIEAHPYWKTLDDRLKDLRAHICALEKRITFLQESMGSKTPFEANEAEILILATKPEINAKKQTLYERENYNYRFMLDFIPLLTECELNLDNLLKKAEQKRRFNKDLDSLLKSVNWDFMNQEIEAKVKLYERLKNLIP
jgi:hypothetical protein